MVVNGYKIEKSTKTRWYVATPTDGDPNTGKMCSKTLEGVMLFVEALEKIQ